MVGNNRISVWSVVLSVVFALALVSLWSCDTLLGDDSDDSGDTKADDGSLTVQLLDGGSSPCPDPLMLAGPDGPDANHNTPVFTVWVYRAGSTADNDMVASGIAEFDDDSNSTVHLNKPETNDAWQGTGGESYDVYPVAYCTVESGSIEHFNDNETHWDNAMAAVHNGSGSGGYGVPITYKQDGNKAITTASGDYGRLLIDPPTTTVEVTGIPTRDPDPFLEFYVRVFEEGVEPGPDNPVAGNGVDINGETTAEATLHRDEEEHEWLGTPGETYQVLLMLFGADGEGGPAAEGSRHHFFTYTHTTGGMELVRAFADAEWGDPDNLQF